MRRLLTLAFLPLTLALVMGFAACGGDDDDGGDGDEATTATAATEDGDDERDAPQDGNLNSYFAALEELVVAADNEQEEIGDSLNRDFADDEEYVTAHQEAFHESGEKFELRLLELYEMDPPEGAADAHQAYADNLQAALILLSGLTAEVDEATTAAEVDAAFDTYGPDIIAANADTEQTCFVLQEIADTNSAGVDLECDT